MTPQFFIIDAHGFLHRNYHALPKLTTSSGLEVGALYGFLRWLLKMLQQKHPEYVAVCFDSPGGCARRKALLPTYKANRPAPDDALVRQLNLARELVSRLGLAVVAQEGVEADDLMAFLARRAQAVSVPSVLVTADKDIYQFLNEYISVWPSGKEAIKGPEAAQEKFGLPPQFLPDYFALVGDAVDNIPGAEGIGPKGAVELITKFGHLEDILRAAHNGDPQLRPLQTKRLLESEGSALLSKQLVVLDNSFSRPFAMEDYRVHLADVSTLEKLFARYEFKNLLDYVTPAPAQAPTHDGLFAQPAAPTLALAEVLARAQTAPHVFVHTEDDWLIVGLSAQQYAVLPVAEVQPWEREQLKQLFLNDSLEKRGYDIKLTLRLLELDLGGHYLNCFDGRLANYLLNPSGDLSFAGACAAYFAVTLQAEDTPGLLIKYNQLSAPLQEKLTAQLTQSGQYELYRTLELPLMMVLADMENKGLRIDPGWLESFKALLEQEMAQCQASIDGQAGYPVNINSPKQLGALLFEQMKIPPVRKTKTGYSTDESVLEEIAGAYPIARTILDYRASSKLKSTYVDNLLLLADDNQIVHSYLDQTGTVTGRLSSSSPNLQNIPVRTEKGRQLRRAFCAAPGHVLLSVDYSQIDLRVLAHESQDPVLIEAFLQGGDIHTQTAAQVFGVMPLLVTPEMRSSAKAINFGIIYGQGPMGLSESLGISLREAKAYIDNYFQTYKGVRAWIDKNIALARQNGYVKTMLGHVRYLPEFNMGVGSMASFAQRAAINTIVQGGSADIIKKAMLDVFALTRGTDVNLIMQIHDELIFELPQEKLTPMAMQIKQRMQNAVTLRVPLLVSAKAGKNWYELEKLSL